MGGGVKTINENEGDKKIVMANNENLNSQLLNEEEKQIFNIIVDKLIEPINETDLDASLFDLGINSITFILIVVELESALEIEFDDDMLVLENVKNIKTLIDYVCKKKL